MHVSAKRWLKRGAEAAIAAVRGFLANALGNAANRLGASNIKCLDTPSAKALAWANERLELTQTATGITSWEWDLQTDDFFWTAGRKNLLTLGAQAEMKHADVLSAVHPDDQVATRRAAYAAVEKNQLYSAEFRVIMPDKSVRWVASRGKVFADDAGKPVRMLGINMDITERKRAETALLDSEERFRATFEHAPVAIAHALPSGQITLTNTMLCDMLGYRPEELAAMKVIDIIHPDDQAAAREMRDQMLSGKILGYTRERFYRRKDGSSFAAEVNVALVRAPDQSPKYAILVIKDITDRRLVAQEMRLALEAADAASQAKSQFLANVSHEIRTPLTAILGFAELLTANRSSNDQMGHFVDVIVRNGVNLKALIDDILDLSKVEAERLDIDKTVMSIGQLLDELRALLSAKAASKGVELRVESEGNVPCLIASDQKRLKQILLNVVDNAIKFTSKGTVDIHVRAGETTSAPSMALEFSVTDTGIGISVAQQSRLFQAFSQADASTTREYGGTGLGLLLSRQLARLLGGDLVLKESMPGKGSTFVVTIVAGLVDAEHDPHQGLIESQDCVAPIEIAGISVLVVEDTVDARDYIIEVLRIAGAEVEMASDGRDAIEKALAGHHDIVLMDIQMPVMDGRDAIAELRRRGFSKPIVALSAHAFLAEQERIFQAGCTAYLTKPIHSYDLLRVISLHAGKRD